MYYLILALLAFNALFILFFAIFLTASMNMKRRLGNIKKVVEQVMMEEIDTCQAMVYISCESDIKVKDKISAYIPVGQSGIPLVRNIEADVIKQD